VKNSLRETLFEGMEESSRFSCSWITGSVVNLLIWSERNVKRIDELELGTTLAVLAVTFTSGLPAVSLAEAKRVDSIGTFCSFETWLTITWDKKLEEAHSLGLQLEIMVVVLNVSLYETRKASRRNNPICIFQWMIGDHRLDSNRSSPSTSPIVATSVDYASGIEAS
jgi:hypothetical protein